MGKVKLIIWREFMSRIKKRSFIIMAFLGPIIISLFAYLAIQVSDSYKTYKVLVVDPYEITGNWNKNSKWCNFTGTTINKTDKEFESSDYDILIYVNKKFTQNNTIQLYYKEKSSPYARADIQREFELKLEGLKLDIHNINPTDYNQIKQRVVLKDKMVNGADVEFAVNTSAIGFVFGALIFFFVFNFGVQVMRGVIEEKTNRIVEIVISSVRPIQLMTGKILGIGLAALTQFLLWTSFTALILIGFKNNIYQDPYDPSNQVIEAESAQFDKAVDTLQFNEVNVVAELFYHSDFTGPILFFIFFLVFGYLFYAGIFASIGSAVDNDTDVQQFLFPVTLPLLLGFVVAWVAATQPDNPLVFWFSIMPFTAPVVMMTRLVIGFEPEQLWQLYLSMGTLILSTILMFMVSARIYKIGILMYGKKASLKDLWRWAIKGA